jgi:hypothetical protein
MGGRAAGAPLTPRRAPGAPKWARKPRNDTQEVANSFWSYFYGGLSWSFVSKLSPTTACLVLGLIEGHLNRLGLGASAFEITSRRFPFERVAAAMSKSIFDMGFVMADVRPSLPTVSAED